MTLPTQTEFEDAKVDLDDLETIVNGSNTTTVTTRLGSSVPTAAKALNDSIASVAAINDRGAWATATAYAVKDLVVESGVYYICIVAHTSSGTFATDKNSKWRVYQGVLKNEIAEVFDSVADMKTAADSGQIPVGYKVQTLGYYTGWETTSNPPKGGNHYELVDAGSAGARPAEDGGSVIHVTGGSGGLYLKGLFLDGTYWAEQWGAASGNDISTEAINASAYVVSINGVLRVGPGNFALSTSGFVFNDKCSLIGSGRDNTVFEPAAGVAAITFGGNDVILKGFAIRDPAKDQNNRVAATGIKFTPTASTSIARKYCKFEDILIEYLDGRALDFNSVADASLIESRFEFVHIRHCGNATTPAVDFWQNNSTADSFNNITFDQFSIYAPHGVGFSMVSHKDAPPYSGVRDIRFENNCIIHGRAGAEGGPLNFNLMEFKNFSNIEFPGLRLNTVAAGFYGLHLDTDRSVVPGILASRRPVIVGASIEDDVYIGEVLDTVFEGNTVRATTLEVSANATRTKIGLNATEYDSASGLIVSDSGTNTWVLNEVAKPFRAQVDSAGSIVSGSGLTSAKLGTGQYRVSINSSPTSNWIPYATALVSDKNVAMTNKQATSIDVYTRDLVGTLVDTSFFISFDTRVAPL